MATLRKERSTVRFAQGTTTLPKLSHVYAPELHRQVTERVPFSRLGHVLNHFTDVGLGEALDPSATATAKVEIGEILEKSFLSLKRNRVGLDILPPVQVHCFTHWHVQPETRVVCLLPVKFHKAKVTQRDIGHSLIKLPPPSSKSVTPSDEQHQQGLPDVRTKDGLHVSPRKLHVACAKLVQSTLVKHGVPKENVQVSLVASDLSIVVQLPCGWRAELVPCVASPDGGDVFYVAKRYTSEPHERGDVSWRPCFSVTEQELLHSISSTDGGLRVGAMHVLCRLLSRDFRLAHFTCYHVQTALLHDMDFHVDFSPRWQRCTLESCVRSLLSTLLYFVERSSLPHFDLNQLNLWEYMTPRQLTQARGALSRLLTNENALISLLRRASGESSASFDFGLT
nr:hypothetical protein BaRGS_014140 [Batillaria attramentaria]